MQYEIKIEYQPKQENASTMTIEKSVFGNGEREEVLLHLGQMLYAEEVNGAAFVTADLFDDIRDNAITNIQKRSVRMFSVDTDVFTLTARIRKAS